LEVGLFDEAFKIYGNEDLELAARLTRSDVRLLYEPAALARQYYEKDFAGLARDNYAKGQTAVLLAQKQQQVYAQLKLNTYHQESKQWRAARAGLLSLSRWWARTPEAVIHFVQLLERSQPDRLSFAYRFATDYFFWLGVRTAQRQAHGVQQPGVLAEPTHGG
jgi:predicted component of type VI protein secretion system